MNIRSAIEFDETVDIDTILPVLIYPIISEQHDRTIAVLEYPIKHRTLIK